MSEAQGVDRYSEIRFGARCRRSRPGARCARAADADFSRWLQLLWVDAQKQGVSSATFDEALTGVQLDLNLPDLVLPGRRPKEQAEFIKLPAAYLPEAQLSRLAHAGRRHLTTYKPRSGQSRQSTAFRETSSSPFGGAKPTTGRRCSAIT
jgi:Membrane-bound lytic murein transglycosylase B